jgi:hypothetical protein
LTEAFFHPRSETLERPSRSASPACSADGGSARSSAYCVSAKAGTQKQAAQGGGGKECQTACKPGSVLPCGRGDHSSGMRVATHLTRPTRTAMRKTSGAVPIWSCSRWGLPCRLCCQRRGALLPHHFNLAAASLPKKIGPVGGVISVALSLGSPPPAVNRHRLSVEPGLSSNRLPCPRSPGCLTAGLYAGIQASAKSTMAAACSCMVS